MSLPSREMLPVGKVLYIFNHNSYLDIFLMPCIGLKNTRTVISKRTRKILPLYLCNLGIGSLFIPYKDEPLERESFFKDLGERFRMQDESIFASPEGVHRFQHSISKFNDGIFRAASVARIPICPIFFEIPIASNPLESYFFRSGRVKIRVLPLIETTSWSEETLTANIKDSRNVFVSEFNEVYGEAIQ